jgi:hypothetical protein
LEAASRTTGSSERVALHDRAARLFDYNDPDQLGLFEQQSESHG